MVWGRNKGNIKWEKCNEGMNDRRYEKKKKCAGGNEHRREKEGNIEV